MCLQTDAIEFGVVKHVLSRHSKIRVFIKQLFIKFSIIVIIYYKNVCWKFLILHRKQNYFMFNLKRYHKDMIWAPEFLALSTSALLQKNWLLTT